MVLLDQDFVCFLDLCNGRIRSKAENWYKAKLSELDESRPDRDQCGESDALRSESAD